MTPIEPHRLHSVWTWVRPGLEHIREKTAQSWLPEDVYVRLVEKSAFLVVIEEGKSFLVYEVMSGDDRRGVLHVWCIYGVGDMPQQRAAVEKWIDDEGRRIGVRCVRAYGRKGWQRQGYMRLVGYVYEREL